MVVLPSDASIRRRDLGLGNIAEEKVVSFCRCGRLSERNAKRHCPNLDRPVLRVDFEVADGPQRFLTDWCTCCRVNTLGVADDGVDAVPSFTLQMVGQDRELSCAFRLRPWQKAECRVAVAIQIVP